MAKKNNELPVNPETGTAATKEWSIDPIPGTSESGFQETKKQSEWTIDPIELPAMNRSTSVKEIDWGKYEDIEQKFIPEGGIEELNRARAKNQSVLEQLGNKSVQVVTGVGLGIAENAGYLFDIEAHIDTMTGVGNDYSNFLTDLAQRGKEAINDNFAVYRENPNQTFDLGDPAWWINHGGDLFESIGEFAVTGAGVGKVLGSGAKGLAMLFKNAKGGAKIAGALNSAATTLTAAELAYIEGAMGGQEVYKNTYSKALEQGMSEEEAKNKASQAAATTVQLNTLINTGLNFTSAKMFTRPMSAAGRLESKFARQAGETLDAWKARLKEEVKQPGVLAGIGGEMTQEALEEVVNEVATALGERKGSELTGLLTDEEKRGGRLGTIIETLGKEETALAAILGAVGGGGQTLVTSAFPSSRRAKQAEADYQRRQLDYVVDRITAFESAQVKMSDALKNKDAKAYEDAVNEAFNTQAISSVISGTQEQVSGIYNEISNLSKEEAEAAGYDIDPASPEYYKRRAADAVEDIKKLSNDYENIINKYNAYDNDATEAGYGEEVFIRHAKKYNVERAIDRAQMRLDKSKAEHQKQLERRGTPMGVNEAVDISNNIKAIDKAVEQTALEINEISKLDARNNASRRDIERRYGIPPKGTSRKQHAFNMIKERVDRMNKQRENLYNALNKAKEDFIEAGNKAEDFRDALDATTIEQNDIQNFQAAIINARETLKQADAEFKKFASQEGRDEFVKLKQDDNAKRRAEEEANAKKAEDDKKAEEEAAKRKAASQKARDKKRSQETEVATEPVETPVATEPTVETSPVVEPEMQDEQEVNREIVGEGILASEETAPQPALEDGDVQNPTEKKKGSAYKTETSKSTSDFLVVPAANSFAYLSKKYKEEGGKKVTETSDKNENLIKELESSVEFQPGDKITLEVDRTATWQDKDGKTWSYDDFVNEDGSVDVANVPIAIKKDGKTVAFVRTQNWILQKDENDNYANVADNVDPEHPMFGNAEYQAKLNLALRNSILKRGSVETTITNKSIGNLSMNLVNGKPTKGKMSELTPKVKTFTIVKNGQFHTNAVDQYSERDLANSKEFLESLNDWNGLVFAELVTPNGSALMIPVSIPNLSEQQAETIYNGLVASFNKTEDIRSQVFGETDLDLFTDSGVLEFLKLFTHTTDESDANFKEKVDGEGKDNARHLNYSTKTGKISYARHNRGVVTISSLEELEANKADFMAFLGEKLFSVRLSSINSTEAVSEPVINNDGTVSSNHYSSYNDYIKTSLETDVKGSEINENEESYFDQPVIEFSQDLGVPPMEKTDEVAEPVTPVEPTTQEVIKDKSEPEVDTTNLDLLNDIDELMGIDDSIGYERSSKPVNDFEMTDLQKEFLKKGLEAYLVVDKDTNVPYNAYKQSQVVDSIVELVARSMQSGSNREQAFEQAKQVFMKRQQLYATAEANFDKLTDEQKRKLAITTITDAQELSDEFKRVNRNWEAFSKRATQKLASIFGIKKTINDTADSKEVEDALDGYEELESQLDKVSFDDGATFQTNHKDTASARLKLFLALQESPNRTFLNLKSFIPFDTVFDELQMMLAGTEPNYDSFIQHLYLVGTDKPYVKNLITKLESSDQQIRNEFVVAFSKQHNTFSNVLWSMKPVYKNGKIVSYSLQMQPVDSNRNDVVKKIESQWIENQKSSPIVKVKSGQLMINPEVAKQFASIVDELAVKPDIEKTRDLLKMIGIDMPIKALKDLEQNSVKKTGQSFVQHFKTGMFKHMAKALNKNHSEEESSEVESLLELNNPLTGVDREGSSIKVLASLAAAYSEAIHSNSFRDTEGKTIYSYSLNSALSHKMRELTSNDGNNATLSGLAKISFSKYSHWGEQLRTNGAFRESFGLYYMDGLSKRGSKQKGVKRKDQSEKELELQAIGLFQNQGRNTGFFIYPTISDKTTTPLIQALKHDVKVLFNADGTYTFGKATKKIIHDLVRSEIDRIENYKPGKDTIKGYDTGGATKFFLFPGLNEILGDERLSDGKVPVDIQTKLFAAAENHIKELVNNTVKAWEDLGIKTDESLMLDASYVNTVAKPKTQNGNLDAIALYAAIDMEVNYMISNANVMQLMSGDPALHYKKDVETTMVEYTKRLAKDIAPGLDGNWSKPKYKTVFLKDKDTVSQHLEEYRKIIGEKSKSYTGIEGTDAQEYTTLAEHLNVMNAYGKLSAEDYIKFKRKAREGKPFSGKELDIILQPMKPVYVGNEFDFERDVNKVTYIKSSSFPLIPQFTKGLEIDALRKEMEKHKIDRAAYVTATKLGSTKATQIWDGNVMAEGFSLEGKAVVLDRKGFRIQQEVPYKEDKVKILTVSQMNKLLFEGILGIKGMSELKARKEAIRIELFEKGKKELLKELGATEVDGEYVFKDLKKVKDILIKEAIDRNYPINDIQALELSEDGKSFKIPLGFNASSKKFESVLMSLITNRILKQKIAGKSYVQGSSAGVLTGANKSKKWSELTDKELGGITFTANANLDNGLKFVRKENGEVKGAQLLVPFYFRDSNGKPLKISDYTKVVDGKTIIDSDKMDSELLRLVGARIPNQGHSSMLPIEIVGFLPESMGDLVIVPDEITKQMGSDFDVDKLYTYQYEYTIGADGKLSIAMLNEVAKDTKFDYSKMPDIKTKNFTFNDQQKEGYYKIKNWIENTKESAFVLEGYAGTGKTTIVKEVIDNIFEKSGLSVVVSAPTHKAKSVIAKSTGRDAETIHRLLGLAPDTELETFDPENLKLDPKNKPSITKYNVLILDEASMINKELYDHLVSVAKDAGVRILFMGDPAQLPPIGEDVSKVFTEISNKHVLTKVERQTGGNPLGPIYDAIRSNLESSVDMFKHETSLTKNDEGIEIRTPLETSQVLDEATENFKNDLENTKVLAWTNAKVKLYNAEIRKRLKPDATSYIESGDLLTAYSAIGINYKGEALIENGQDAIVKEVVNQRVDEIDILVVKFEGIKFENTVAILNPTEDSVKAFAKKVNSLKQTALTASGSIARKKAWVEYYNFVRSIITPVDIIVNGKIIKSKDIDYGYATTVHKSQGSTYNNVYIDEVDIDKNQKVEERNKLKYVALSRPRIKATLISNKNSKSPVGKAIETAPKVEQPKLSLKNEYVDIHWKVLTHPEVLPRILAPLDQKGEYSVAGEAELIHGIRSKNAEQESFLYRRGQQTAFIQNRGGKAGVGIFSLASTFNATIQDKDLSLKFNTPEGPVPRHIKVFEGYSLSKLSGKGTNSIADKATIISDMQSAAVDNAKEQTLDKLNLNSATFGAANAMAQLEDDNGKNVTIQHISRLLSQKVILDYVKELEKLSDSTSDTFVSDKSAEAIARVKEKYSKNATGTNITKLNPENMLKMIENESTPNGEWYSQQLLVLEAFEEFNEVGTALTNIQSAINSDSKGVDPTFFQVTEKINRISNVVSNPLISGTSSLVSMTTEVGAATQLGPVLAMDLMGQFLPQGSDSVKSIFNELMNITGKDKLHADLKQRIFDEYKSFIFTNNGWFANNVNEARVDLLIDNETPSLATRVAEAQKTWGKDNFLLKRLMPKFSTIKGDPARVEYIASAGERLDEQESTRAFVDMLSSNDPVQAKLGRDLVTYAYLTSGNQNATNFMKFIPNIYLSAMKIDNKFEEFNWNDDSKSISFITQLIQNNPDLATTMPEKVSELVKNDKFALPDLASENNEFSNLIYPVVENGKIKLTYPKFFKVRENKEYKLYMNVGQDPNGSGKHMYERINTLGGEGNISEYSFNSPMLSRSIYQKNNVSVADSMLSTGVPNTSVSASVDNPNANTSILAEYDLTPETEFEDFMNSIKKISKESANPAHRVLAKILYAAKVQLDPFTFKVNNTMSSFGKFSTRFDNGNKVRLLEINTNNHSTDKGFDSNSFEATLLHELGHGYTSQIIDAYFKDESKLPENMRKAVKSLNAIRQKLFNSLSEEEQQEATEFAALSPEEKKSSRLPRATKMQYYALTNTKEFFTATLTDESFQEYLNGIQFEGEKSLLDRFLEVLSKLYKAIAENLGVEVKSDSALEYAIHESVNLIQHSGNIDSTMSAEDSMIIGDVEYVSYPIAVSLFEEFGLFTQRGEPRQYLKNTKGEAEINAKIKEMTDIKSPFMQKYGRYYRVTKRIHKTTEPGGKQREFYILAFRKANSADLSTYYSSDESIGFGKDPESTLSPSMEKLIARLDSRIRELNRAMSESKTNKIEYQEKIDVLEKQKELIIEENNLKAMQDVAKTHLDWASNILDHKSVSTSELKEVEHIINVWGDVKSLFKEDYQSGGKYQEVLSQISNRAEDLNTKLLDISKQVILTEINSDSARQVKMRDLEVMKDITSTRANMLDLSHVDHPVIQSLDNWLKNAARDTNYEFTLFAKDAKTVFEKLKQHPEFKKNGYDVYLQKDKNGKWTGGLTHRYSQDWYDFRTSISKKRDRKKDNPEAWKRYFEELKKNEVIVDSRVLFDKDGNRKSDGVAKKHIKELEAEFGQARAEEMIAQAEEKYMEYLTHLAAFELSVETERDVNPEMTEEQAKDKIARWKQENSPFAYIDSYKGNLIIRGLKMRGYRYTVAKPRKMIDGKPTKWYDKNYEKIENDPVLKEFYDFYRSAMAKNMSVLPTYALKDTKNNFIPYIKKQLMERYTDSGMKGAVSGLYENFVDSISSVESSTVSADRNIRTGNVNKRIPIKFLQEASIEDKSKDLMKGLEMFTLMALNYKHKSKVEDKVLITQRLINEAAQQQVTANNEVQRDSEGNLYETKDGNVNLKKLVQHTIDYSLYDKRRNEGDPTGIFVTKNPKDSIKATKIAKQISALNRKHSLGQITDEEHTEQVTPLQKELDELGGRNISTADIADFTMKVTQLKGMAINIFSASNNMTFGLLSNIVHAAGGEDFTMKEAMKAYRMMLNSTSKSLGLDRAGVGTSTAKKINALVEKFDILFEVNESAYRGSNKSKSKLTPYELQKRGEYFVQGMNMVARMLNEKVMTKDGKETSLFEAFDENGNWRTDVYGENSQWSGDINDDTQMKDFRKFRNRLIQLNKRIHGNYDPNSFPMIKKSVLGRFASQFRSWIAESVAARFDYEQWDDQLGRNTKGTYRTIAQLGPMATIKYFAKIALARKNGLSDLSDVDRANLKKAFTEVSAIIALNIMALSVMALADDDDDDKAVRTALINHLKRVEADFTFYTSPSSFDQILSNPIPAIRTYMDAEKALKHTSQYIMQDEELDGRKKLESEDVIEKWLKAFPFLNQLPKAKYQTEKIF